MSDASPMPRDLTERSPDEWVPGDRADEIFAEVAELDLALFRHVQARALATEDPDVLNGLVRSCQRLTRSIRQTLAFKARLKRERAQDEATRPTPRTPQVPYDPDRAERRAVEVRAAVKRVIYAEHEAEALEREEGCMRDYCRGLLEERLEKWIEEDGFGLEPLDAHVAEACHQLGLSRAPAARWRNLPDPPWANDPVPWDDDDDADTS